MTPAQVEEAARRRYNAVDDSFFSQDELFKIIYEAEQELALDALVIEAKDATTSTVIGTRIYSLPSLFIAVKRLEYGGQKLKKVDDRDIDVLSLNGANISTSGTPEYYWVWNDQLYLYPTPDAVGTLTVYGYKEAVLLTTASTTLSVPTRCHYKIVDYVAAHIALKDENTSMYDRYMQKWDDGVKDIKKWTQRKKRTDGFAIVKDEDTQATSILGSL